VIRRHALRNMRRVQAAVGATAIAIPTSAALAATAAPPNTTRSDIAINLTARKLDYGRDVVVHGRAPSSAAGQRVALEFAVAHPGRAPKWTRLGATTVGVDGRFRLAAPLRRSGSIRAVANWLTQGQVASGNSTTTTTTTTSSDAAAADAGGSATAPEHVTVAARLSVKPRALEVLGGGGTTVHGRLLPGTAGRRVRLQALQAGRWQTIASARTNRRGSFGLRFSPQNSGRERLRVAFAGDPVNSGARDSAGSVMVFTQSLASWYNDGGTTGCGFHAYYGVANVSLPCGTKVTFSYGGRTVNAVVDDRGPYVGGRRWDLNQNTAGALGFSGVGDVWSSQ